MALAAGLTAESSSEEVSAIALEVTAKISGSRATAAPVREAIAVFDSRIRQLLDEPDMTARQIWRLLTEAGHGFSERSINRYIQKIAPSQPAVTVRLEVDSGTQAQVDFGNPPAVPGDAYSLSQTHINTCNNVYFLLQYEL